MSYCQNCGEKNLPTAHFCKNCSTTLPSPEKEKLQPGYGYDIHKADCDHGLKIEPMSTRDKLALLGTKKLIYLGNLCLILCMGVLLMFPIFRTANPMWQEFLEQKAGLFGPKGQLITAVYFLLLCGAFLMAAIPLYTRNTYNPAQLLPAMVLEALVFPVIGLTLVGDLCFGEFLGTALCTGGFLLLITSLSALILQFRLMGEYKKMKTSGIYAYVAN